jgi:hypothetical protein
MEESMATKQKPTNSAKLRGLLQRNLETPASVRYDGRSGIATLESAATKRGSAAFGVAMPLERLALVSHYVRARTAFASDLEMSEMLGIDRTRLIAWKKGTSKPRQEQLRYLADVATTVDALRRFLHPTVMGDWLVAPKIQLEDRSPVDLLREGRLADVLQAANASEHGSFA